jgi:fucose permease
MATYFLILIYFAFISLGLPDALLGVGWPVMQPDFGVPFSAAGFVAMVISGGTIISSLLSGRIIQRFGTGKVTFVSVLMTALALLGFSLAPAFWWLLFMAVPLGLGAGSVDSGLNEYVAEHYQAHHMNWLHCFWGIGAMTSPLIMSSMISGDHSWRSGYLTVGIIQMVLVVILFFSLPLWSKVEVTQQVPENGQTDEPVASPVKRGLFYPLQIPGVKFVMVAFLFYCGIEGSMGLWGSSYLVQVRGMEAATAAAWVSTFYGAITVGRFIAGFIAMKLSNKALIRIGEAMILGGVVLMVLPLPDIFAVLAFALIGLGCAPIFPGMLHETPVRFGKENAQMVMGFQMATAYVGATFLPPFFGFVADGTHFWLLPVFILVYVVAMSGGSESINRLLTQRAVTSEPNPTEN